MVATGTNASQAATGRNASASSSIATAVTATRHTLSQANRAVMRVVEKRGVASMTPQYRIPRLAATPYAGVASQSRSGYSTVTLIRIQGWIRHW